MNSNLVAFLTGLALWFWMAYGSGYVVAAWPSLDKQTWHHLLAVNALALGWPLVALVPLWRKVSR